METNTTIENQSTDASLVKVVIPIYKNQLNETETMSLQQTFKVLKKHHFVIVCPENLDVQPILDFGSDNKIEVIRFPNDYFKSIEGYNHLMLSDFFYEKFLDSKYILICQTDVIVVKDELAFWCAKNYDYIGAPWIASPRNAWNKSMLKIRNAFFKKKKSDAHFFKVGNGGFSLRNVRKHYEIVSHHKKEIVYCQRNRTPENHHVEDVFFSMKAPSLVSDFKIPDYKEALGFAMDRRPQIALKLNHNKLPFGIHGFDKRNVKDFWIPVIKNILSKQNS